ncbi:MAG: IreB family regulatory phosphoprotein [Lachnospiraceae bacterium]|nr:IreB family regulatory phosphoprotein [Lachnospiraceae bacterium]
MEQNNGTQLINISGETQVEVAEVLRSVYQSLKSKGYNPISQIVGYVISGDPTYITSFNSARSLIMKVERDEIIEELMKNYIETKLEGGENVPAKEEER